MNVRTVSVSSYRGDWNYPTAIRFGVGRAAEIPSTCRAAGMDRPLLVTDCGLASLPMIGELLAALNGEGLAAELFADLEREPAGADVAAGVAAYRSGGCNGVLAVGGGSALDAGKAVALMVGQVRPIWDFEDVGDHYRRANADGIAPVVAVPTTAGTGSEVGRAAVITNEASSTKTIIFHPRMMPQAAVLDPALTVGLPPHLTAATGMDALAHALEAYCAPGYHPLADGIALEAMRLVKENLVRAYADGTDLEARAHMLASAMMGAAAFQKGLGGVHAVSHPAGALFHLHHGLLNAVLTPYVLVFNRPAVERRIVAAARYLDLRRATFGGFVDWLLELRGELDIPDDLATLGVNRSDVEMLAEAALNDPSVQGNPVPLKADDLSELIRRAVEGDLGL